MTKRQLQSILKKHQKWLNDEKGGEKANLQGAGLQRAGLQGAGLQRANLQEANLQEACLHGANLRGANLREANLQGAGLQGANLRGANLQGANLDKETIQNINKYRPFQIVPQEGSFIAWKKGRDGEIIKLEIPASAKRTSSLIGRKCRASKAKILSIKKDGKKVKSCQCWNISYHFTYEVGKIAVPDKYDDDIRVECSSGIHFFITREEAEIF